jgi:DNA polymerase-4
MVGGLAHERGIVACPSYEARARGVRTGTTLHQASRLIPDGIFLRGDFNRYRYFSERLYEIIGNYTPDYDHISQDEACLLIGSIIGRFHDIQEIGARLQNEVWNKLSLSTSIGIAANKVTAKIASEYKKPMGLTIIPPEDTKNFLSPLPIKNLPGIGHTTEKILHEMGIRTIGQLAAVPEKYLETIFGLNGLKISYYARGEDGPPVRDYKIIRSVSRETGFADDITDRQIILSHFYYLLDRAAAKLRLIGKKAAGITIKFRYADFQHIEGNSRLSPASNDQDQIFPVIEMMFDRIFTRRLGIRFVGITLNNLKNFADGETFFEDCIEKQKRLLRGLDQTRRKEGFFSLMTGRTFSLATRYQKGDTGYELRTPGLSQ